MMKKIGNFGHGFWGMALNFYVEGSPALHKPPHKHSDG